MARDYNYARQSWDTEDPCAGCGTELGGTFYFVSGQRYCEPCGQPLIGIPTPPWCVTGTNFQEHAYATVGKDCQCGDFDWWGNKR